MCSFVADRFGRRAALLVGITLVGGGIFGEVFANTNGAFLIGKMILGFGLGFYLTVGPLYCSEVDVSFLRNYASTNSYRYLLSDFVESQPLASTLASSSDSCFRTLQSEASGLEPTNGRMPDHFRSSGSLSVSCVSVLNMTNSNSSVFLAIGLPFAPESPWYYVRKGRLQDAEKCLRQLYGPNVDIGPKLAVIIKTTEDELQLQSSATWFDCFRGTNLIRTGISTGVFACQHLSGIVFVLGFSTYFFELAGVSTSTAFDLGIGVTACGVVGVLLSWSALNTFGRRKLFVGGMISLTTVLFLIGIMSVIPTAGAKWVQASLTVVYALFYQITIGSIAFAVLGETPSAALRAKTLALATATQSIFGTVMNFAVPYMVNPDKGNLKGKVGFVFGGLSLAAAIWSFLYVPELKNRTFEEIDSMFEKKITPRKMGAYSFAEGYDD